MLTIEELNKYKACLYMQRTQPKKIEQTKELDAQILFIRSHGQGKMKFYPVTWFQENEKRTAAIYYKVYEAYSLQFNKLNQKYIRAEKRREELEEKILSHVSTK